MSMLLDAHVILHVTSTLKQSLDGSSKSDGFCRPGTMHASPRICLGQCSENGLQPTVTGEMILYVCAPDPRGDKVASSKDCVGKIKDYGVRTYSLL